ncbi:MAG TPA: DUF3310 domain-containing protein [bacterium]|nr:MAG: hypothetical protein UX37_C0022G0012 [Microgenomates group bacterium GW2011_GWA2_46_16]
MSDCIYTGCKKEAKIEGFCVKHFKHKQKALGEIEHENSQPVQRQIDEPCCPKCGRKASEVRTFIKKRGMCKDCAYSYKSKKRKKKDIKLDSRLKPAGMTKEKPAGMTSKLVPECFYRGADSINHPPHYTQGKIEVIDFIADQQMGYMDGNIIKYIARYRHKGSAVEDLKKAKWYLERLLAEVDGN